MSLEKISIKLLESKYAKVKNYTIGNKVILVESENGEIAITDDEKGYSMETEDKIVTGMTEAEVDNELGVLIETQNSVSAKDLAKILTINNTKGRKIKETDVDEKMLVRFNNDLKKFSSKHKNFDVFSDDYDGEPSDEFIDMLVSIADGTKADLFEGEEIPEMIDTAVSSEEDLAKLQESVGVLKMKSPVFGASVEKRLKEAVGSPMKVGSVAYKLRKGIPLKESVVGDIAKLTGAREQAIVDFLKRIDVEDKDQKYVLDALKRGKITGVDFTTAMLGKPDNKYEKIVLKGMGL